MQILRSPPYANMLAAIVLSIFSCAGMTIGGYGEELQSDKYIDQMKHAVEIFSNKYQDSTDLANTAIKLSVEDLATEAFCGPGRTEDTIKKFVKIDPAEVADETDSAGYSMYVGKSLGIFTSVLLIVHVSKQNVCTASVTQSGI